jgi:ferredoxin
MATLSQRLPENVPGPFYVDAACIDCERCREVAPAHFTRHDPGRYSFVFLQPRSAEELALCRQALEECPVEAIGDDAEHPTPNS